MQQAKKIGITLVSSFYTHGEYDWIVFYTAENIVKAKQFCDLLLRTYAGYIANLHLIENLFWVRKYGRLNPNRKTLIEIT